MKKLTFNIEDEAGISFPEIYEMQCRAIFEAIVELKSKK